MGKKSRQVDAQTSAANAKLGNGFLGKLQGVSTLEFYTHLLTQWIRDGSGLKPVSLRDDAMQIEFDRVFTSKGCKMFFYVKGFPMELDYSWMGDLRDFCTRDHVRINFTQDLYPFRIDWESYEMKAKREQYSRMLKESAADRIQRDEVLGTVDDLTAEKRESWLARSWAYIMDADVRRRALILSDCVIEVMSVEQSAEADANLQDAIKALYKYCNMNNIRIQKVRNIIYDFMQRSSPFRVMSESLSRSFINTRVLTDEVVANFSPYEPGKLDDLGTYMGVDVTKYTAVYHNFRHSSQSAENILIVGMTGSGKSVVTKSLVGNFLADKINVIVHDRDGEYLPLCEALNGISINLSKASGSYFDAMRISDPTGVPEVDGGLFEESRIATTTVFNALVDQVNGMSTEELRIYNDAYNNLLRKVGVVQGKMETWRNSYSLSYHKLYEEIRSLGNNSEYRRMYGESLKMFVHKLSLYFEEGGLKAYLFKHPINIVDILGNCKPDSPPVLVVINMEVDVASGNTEADTIDNTLKYLTSNYLSGRIVNFFRSQNKFTFEAIEEFQRVCKNKMARESAMGKITGNRKKNAITGIITNAPRALIEAMGDSSAEIVENINNLIVGRVNAKAIPMICDTFSLAYCEDVLQSFIDNPAAFGHCFLMKMRGDGVAITKQLVPPNYINSPIFATRTSGKDEDESYE